MSRYLHLNGRYYRQYPAEKHLGHAEEELELGVDNTAFLLVDVYGKGYDSDFAMAQFVGACQEVDG